LAAANEIRLARPVVKADLCAGHITFAAALEHPATQSMTIFDLLTAQFRWGRTRAVKLLGRLVIGENRQVRDLTAHQRELICDDIASGRWT
jgi:hypothetical protein